MTTQEAKERYGVKAGNEDGYSEGYVTCDNCPCFDGCNCVFPEGMCDGYGDAYCNIVKFFAQNEVQDDPVSHPSHYTQGDIECIQAMEAAYGKEATAHFCICNAFKYLWRTEHKNGIEDIDKAIWYLNKYKELKSNERTEAV